MLPAARNPYIPATPNLSDNGASAKTSGYNYRQPTPPRSAIDATQAMHAVPESKPQVLSTPKRPKTPKPHKSKNKSKKRRKRPGLFSYVFSFFSR